MVWEQLDRLGASVDLDEFLWPLLARIELSLGLTFHRFISKSLLCISVSVRDFSEDVGFPRKVRPHDPFAYSETGRTGYPKIFEASLPGVGPIWLNAHVWPAGANQPEFRLGRRTGTAGQGIYFYRNDRMIQAGGWNGVVKDASDSELSLARISVDLPPGACRQITVQKSALQVTAALAQALESARAGEETLRDYIDHARRSYRAGRRQPRSARHVPVVPGAGFPAAPRRTIAMRLSKDNLFRDIDFEWVALGRKQVFAIDADGERILLNSKYRSQIIGPVRASGVDAPLLKLLLFLLFQNEFNRERVSVKHSDWLAHCNWMLYEAIKVL